MTPASLYVPEIVERFFSVHEWSLENHHYARARAGNG